ncbi:MAG: STAS domain-containing protein [Fibromonadaceae bacterium]|jgi:anti-anti-sigma factor|nr:STAS domain-containing protein [Fibromonadaceae bacterium]
MAEACVIEDKESYYLVSDFDSETSDFRAIFTKIEESLRAKSQDFVLSLASVKVLYSSHLAVFVKINQMLRKENLTFALVDISPEIRNLLQITQLDSIFPVYENMEELEKNRESIGKNSPAGPNFEWQIIKDGEGLVNIVCKGDMATGDSLKELQKNTMSFSSILFDFSKLNSIDNASLAFLESLAERGSIQITGASKELIEHLRQKPFYEKIKTL